MKKRVKIFIVYFPVILVAGQVLVNLLSFVWMEGYLSAGFYLNTFFGTNVFFAVFLVAFTFMFKFCAVSRWAALAEFAFALNYLIVQSDNLYNILFQVIVGCMAIGLTFRHYLERFPLCRLSLLIHFIKSVVKHKSCEKGIESYDRDIKSEIRNHAKNRL